MGCLGTTIEMECQELELQEQISLETVGLRGFGQVADSWRPLPLCQHPSVWASSSGAGMAGYGMANDEWQVIIIY